MKLDAYVRVSRVAGREGDSFISPELQERQCRQWAELRGATIAQVHVDLDKTGGRMDRPGLEEALRRVEAGETDGIVVAKFDRFARSLSGALNTIERLDRAGGSLASVAEGIDPTTPAGKFQRGIFLLLAEFQREQIRESWDQAQGAAVARGVHIASRVPTGYVKGPDGRLEPHPTAAPIVGRVFQAKAAGASWRDLAKILNDAQVEGPYGSPHWRTRAVSHMISNRVYLGEARSGRHVNQGAHQPLTDRATWEAAQTSGERSTGEGALLTGLIRCAGCRYVMKADKMTLRSGERTRIYRCRGEHATGICPDRCAVLGTVIEPLVEERFWRQVKNLEATPQDESTGQLERELADAEADLAAYRDDPRILTALGQDRYVEGLTVKAERVERAAAQLAAARRSTGVGDVATLRELWPDLDVGERRSMFKAVFDTVFLRSGRFAIEDRTLFFPCGEGPDDLPGPGRRGIPLQPFPWPDDPPRPVGA